MYKCNNLNLLIPEMLGRPYKVFLAFSLQFSLKFIKWQYSFKIKLFVANIFYKSNGLQSL